MKSWRETHTSIGQSIDHAHKLNMDDFYVYIGAGCCYQPEKKTITFSPFLRKEPDQTRCQGVRIFHIL